MSEKIIKRSGELFASESYYCAESVLLAVSEKLGIQSDLIPKIATGFCSGMARTCGLCGAVSGAIMSLGLVFGRNSAEESVEDNYTAVQTLITEFEKIYGSVNCRDLIGCDLGTDEGQDKFKTKNLAVQCGEFVMEATRITVMLIDKQHR